MVGLGVSLLTSAGCHSLSTGDNTTRARVAALGEGVVEVAPQQMPERPPINKTTIRPAPAPVWRDAAVEQVYFDAYVDEKGDAYPSGSKYVVRRAGGWNIDALRSPSGAYIPAENVSQVAGAPGSSYTPMVSPGTGIRNAQAAVPAAELVDVAQMEITGLFGPEREAMAKALCPAAKTVLLHPTLGWVIVDRTAVHDNPSLPTGGP